MLWKDQVKQETADIYIRELYKQQWLLIITHIVFKTDVVCSLDSVVMVALPNIGGALCSTPQSLADAHY